MVVHPGAWATAIYFYEGQQQNSWVRSFGFPATVRTDAQTRYSEVGDSLASFIRKGEPGHVEVTILAKHPDGLYHLSLHRQFATSKKIDVFEMTLDKVSNESPPLPNTPDDDDCDSQRCSESAPTDKNNKNGHPC